VFSNTSNFGKSNHSKSEVIARLTVTRKNGWKTIVTVQADASFHSFFRFYRQSGNRRSTRELIRTANRNEGLVFSVFTAQTRKPGLELILDRLANYQSESNPIVSHRMRIIKKRAYRKLLSARPDELGLVKTQGNIPMESWRRPRAIPVQLFETVQR
jgi:hypothetical protein